MFNLTELMMKWNLVGENMFQVCVAVVISAIVIGYLFDLNVFGIGAAIALYYILEAVERLIKIDEERRTKILEKDTRLYVRNVMKDLVGAPCEMSETHSAMKRVVEDFIEIYGRNGNGISTYMTDVINELNLDERGDDMSFLSVAGQTLFSTSPTTWEHVATLLCFGPLCVRTG